MFFWIFHKLVKMSWCANWTNIASCTFKTFRLFLQNEMKQEAFHQLTVLSVSVETKVQKGEPRIWFIYFYYSREKKNESQYLKMYIKPWLTLVIIVCTSCRFFTFNRPRRRSRRRRRMRRRKRRHGGWLCGPCSLRHFILCCAFSTFIRKWQYIKTQQA